MLTLTAIKKMAMTGVLLVAAHAGAATVQVTIPDSLVFTPGDVHINAGDSVAFTNGSRFTHTVTADPTLAKDPSNVVLPPGAAAFNSGRLSPGKVFTQTFTVPGLYQYICLPHEAHGMKGRVHVH
jgi:plastocyanin